VSIILLAFLGCSTSLEQGQDLSNTDGSLGDNTSFSRGPSEQPAMRLLNSLDDVVLTITESNLPEDFEVPNSYTLEGGWNYEGSRGSRQSVWAHESPIQFDRKNYSRAPEGVSLSRGDRELSFTNLPSRTSRPGWDISQGSIYYTTADEPSEWEQAPTLHFQDEVLLQDRLNFNSSNLTEEEFISYDLSIGGITQPGMLLPAPSTASWNVTPPTNGVFSTSLRIASRAVSFGPQSDGVRFVVEANGVELFSENVSIDQVVDVEVDLSDFAGQESNITLKSLPLGNSDFDHLIAASPMITSNDNDSPRRVIVIGLDTLRYDALSQHGQTLDTSSALDDFARGATIFENALTSAPRTRPSFRTVLSGRYPLPAMNAPQLGEIMQSAGFVTAGVTANVHLVPRFNFNAGSDYWHYENGVDAEVEIDRAKSWLSEHESQDSYLFLHLMDPHVFYRAPSSYLDMYVTFPPESLSEDMNRWQITSLTNRGEVSEVDKQWLRGRYFGEVAYMADQLAQFLAWVDALEGENLIVIQSDHGEEFWEHGGFEHNHTLYQELVHAVLWIRPPNGAGQRITERVGTVDIVPTVLDFVGIPRFEWPELDGVSLAPLMDSGSRGDASDSLRETLNARPHPVGFLMYDRERWAVVADEHKYIIQTYNGEEELYDLTSDPGEHVNIMDNVDQDRIEHFRERLSTATGWPVGHGWRFDIQRTRESFSVEFSNPIDAQILDPEADRQRRANIEWGDRAPATVEDIGTLIVSDDGLSVRFEPGSRGRGVLAVVAPEGTTATIITGDERTELAQDVVTINNRQHRIVAEPGAVILPLDSVLARLQAAEEEDGENEEADDSSLDALRALGYIE